MNVVEERRCDDDVAGGSRQIVQGSLGAPWVGQMFENLFAQHDVELRHVDGWVSEVEAWKVQRAVRLPVAHLVVPPADVDGISSLGGERAEVFTDHRGPSRLESTACGPERVPGSLGGQQQRAPDCFFCINYRSAPKEHAAIVPLVSVTDFGADQGRRPRSAT